VAGIVFAWLANIQNSHVTGVGFGHHLFGLSGVYGLHGSKELFPTHGGPHLLGFSNIGSGWEPFAAKPIPDKLSGSNWRPQQACSRGGMEIAAFSQYESTLFVGICTAQF
jgi:hypothetical protein